jgi:uncharacterized protein YcbK (DUF882 family)
LISSKQRFFPAVLPTTEKGVYGLFNKFWSRRSFFKASFAGALVLAGRGPAIAKGLITPEVPEGKLSLYNTHNRERLSVVFRNVAGNYDHEALKAVNWILRCHYTNEEADMDIRTIEFLNSVDKKLGGDNEIHIISGYRSPLYNKLLRQEGHGVARRSLHQFGKAIDIHIPGIGLNEVRRVALNLKYGGVGYYPGAGFVHLDSGDFRAW